MQQRGGLSLSEAGACGVRNEQRRPLHAAVSCLVRRRPPRDDRLGGGHERLRRCAKRGRRVDRRFQHDRQPPRGGHLHQAGAKERAHQAHRRRAATDRDGRPRGLLPPDQLRHRRRALQLLDARPHRGGSHRRGVHRRAHRGLRGAEGRGEGLLPGGGRRDLRGGARPDPGGGAHLRPRGARDDLLGHGHLAAHAWYRQREVPHIPRPDDRKHRPRGHGSSSAARTEQRPGGVRRRRHPDGLPRLSERRGSGGTREVRAGLGRGTGPEAGPHGGRDHGRGARRRDQGHVHDGREPLPLRSQREQGAQGSCEPRVPCRPGHLPHRDRRVRRRDPPGDQLLREERHVHQQRPSRAGGPQGFAAAGRCSYGLGDHV